MFKIMMILARLNLAFSVTMSNFFPNTLYEIYLHVLDIGEVLKKSSMISKYHHNTLQTNPWHREEEPQNI